MIRFACPKCRRAFQAPENAAGRSTTCPACGQRFLIPKAIAPIPEAIPVPLEPRSPRRPSHRWPPKPSARTSSDPFDFDSHQDWETSNYPPQRRRRHLLFGFLPTRTPRGHSYVGIVCTFVGAFAMLITFIFLLGYQRWADQLPPGEYETFYGDKALVERELPPYPAMCIRYAGICLVIQFLGLVGSGLSFLQEGARRDWSIAGCVVNGLFIFLLLLR